jgi:hypothetical protein
MRRDEFFFASFFALQFRQKRGPCDQDPRFLPKAPQERESGAARFNGLVAQLLDARGVRSGRIHQNEKREALRSALQQTLRLALGNDLRSLHEGRERDGDEQHKRGDERRGSGCGCESADLFHLISLER